MLTSRQTCLSGVTSTKWFLLVVALISIVHLTACSEFVVCSQFSLSPRICKQTAQCKWNGAACLPCRGADCCFGLASATLCINQSSTIDVCSWNSTALPSPCFPCNSALGCDCAMFFSANCAEQSHGQCAWTGEKCVSLATSTCAMYADETSCLLHSSQNAQGPLCSWSGNDCLNFTTNCTLFVSKLVCNTITGCMWGRTTNTCLDAAAPSSCEEIESRSICDQYQSCAWGDAPGCFAPSSTKNCSLITFEPSCLRFRSTAFGCFWNGSYCFSCASDEECDCGAVTDQAMCDKLTSFVGSWCAWNIENRSCDRFIACEYLDSSACNAIGGPGPTFGLCCWSGSKCVDGMDQNCTCAEITSEGGCSATDGCAWSGFSCVVCNSQFCSCGYMLTSQACSGENTFLGFPCFWNGDRCTDCGESFFNCSTIPTQTFCSLPAPLAYGCLWNGRACADCRDPNNDGGACCDGINNNTTCVAAGCQWGGTQCLQKCDNAMCDCGRISDEAPCSNSGGICLWTGDVCIVCGEVHRKCDCMKIANKSICQQQEQLQLCFWYNNSCMECDAAVCDCHRFDYLDCPTSRCLATVGLECSSCPQYANCSCRDIASESDCNSYSASCVWVAENTSRLGGFCAAVTNCSAFPETACVDGDGQGCAWGGVEAGCFSCPYPEACECEQFLVEDHCNSTLCVWADDECLRPVNCTFFAEVSCTSLLSSPFCFWSSQLSLCLSCDSSSCPCSAATAMECSQIAPSQYCLWGGRSCIDCTSSSCDCTAIRNSTTCMSFSFQNCEWNGQRCFNCSTDACTCVEIEQNQTMCEEFSDSCVWGGNECVDCDGRGSCNCSGITSSQICDDVSLRTSLCLWGGAACVFCDQSLSGPSVCDCGAISNSTVCSSSELCIWSGVSCAYCNPNGDCDCQALPTEQNCSSTAGNCLWLGSSCAPSAEVTSCSNFTRQVQCNLNNYSTMQLDSCAWNGTVCVEIDACPCHWLASASLCGERTVSCSWVEDLSKCCNVSDCSCFGNSNDCSAMFSCSWTGSECISCTSNSACDCFALNNSASCMMYSTSCAWTGEKCVLCNENFECPCEAFQAVYCNESYTLQSCAWSGAAGCVSCPNGVGTDPCACSIFSDNTACSALQPTCAWNKTFCEPCGPSCQCDLLDGQQQLCLQTEVCLWVPTTNSCTLCQPPTCPCWLLNSGEFCNTNYTSSQCAWMSNKSCSSCPGFGNCSCASFSLSGALQCNSITGCGWTGNECAPSYDCVAFSSGTFCTNNGGCTWTGKFCVADSDSSNLPCTVFSSELCPRKRCVNSSSSIAGGGGICVSSQTRLCSLLETYETCSADVHCVWWNGTCTSCLNATCCELISTSEGCMMRSALCAWLPSSAPQDGKYKCSAHPPADFNCSMLTSEALCVQPVILSFGCQYFSQAGCVMCNDQFCSCTFFDGSASLCWSTGYCAFNTSIEKPLCSFLPNATCASRVDALSCVKAQGSDCVFIEGMCFECSSLHCDCSAAAQSEALCSALNSAVNTSSLVCLWSGQCVEACAAFTSAATCPTSAPAMQAPSANGGVSFDEYFCCWANDKCVTQFSDGPGELSCCSLIDDDASCSVLPDCYWTGFSCVSTSEKCLVLRSESSCANWNGCAWNGSTCLLCIASSCTMFSATTCPRACCTNSGKECTSAPPSCNFTDGPQYCIGTVTTGGDTCAWFGPPIGCAVCNADFPACACQEISHFYCTVQDTSGSCFLSMSGNCQPYPPLVCSYVQNSTECDWDAFCSWNGGLCRNADGCFPFLIPKNNAQPYFLFLVGLLKDTLTLIVMVIIGPNVSLLISLARRGKKLPVLHVDEVEQQLSDAFVFYKPSRQAQGANESTDNSSKVKSNIPFSVEEFELVLTKQEMMRLTLHALVSRGVYFPSAEELGTSSLNNGSDLVELQESLVRPIFDDDANDLDTSIDARDRRVIEAVSSSISATAIKQNFVSHVSRVCTKRVVYFSSKSLSDRIRKSLTTFPTNVELTYYIAMALAYTALTIVGTLDTVHRDGLSNEVKSPLTIAMICIFRAGNGSLVGTVALLFVKYVSAPHTIFTSLSALWKKMRRSRSVSLKKQDLLDDNDDDDDGRESSEVSPNDEEEEQRITTSANIVRDTRFELDKVVHVLFVVYCISFLPILLTSLVGAFLYPFIPLGAAVVCVGFQRILRMVRVKCFTQMEGRRGSLSLARSLLEFLTEQQLPTLFIAATIQATVSYAALFFQYNSQISYFDVIAVDFTARSTSCLVSTVSSNLKKDEMELASFAQLLTAFIPFA